MYGIHHEIDLLNIRELDENQVPFYNVNSILIRMTVKLLTLKPTQDVIADIEEIRTKEKKPKIVGYQLTHPYAITLSRVEDDETKLSVNISRWNPYSGDSVYQIPADIVNVICEPLPKLKESWEEKVKTEEEAIAAVTNEVKPTNTVIEQELLNEEHTDTDTKE